MDERLIQIFICIFLIAALIAFPGVAHVGAETGFQLFIYALLPYFLPIIILSNWLIGLTNASTYSSKLFSYLKAYMLSAIGGFPTGAVIIGNMYKTNEISEKEASLLLPILHFPNPLFVIGFVSTDIFGDASFGKMYLMKIHACAIMLLLLLYFRFRKHAQPKSNISTSNGTFIQSVKESVQPILIVAITIIFFTTITSVLIHFANIYIPSIASNQLFYFTCVLEMTNGIHMATQLFQADQLPTILAALLTTQSLSIHLQVMTIASASKIPLTYYWKLRLIICLFIIGTYIF